MLARRIESKMPKSDPKELITAYCMRCRDKQEMKNPKVVTMKNGRLAKTGQCAVCGGVVYKIGG